MKEIFIIVVLIFGCMQVVKALTGTKQIDHSAADTAVASIAMEEIQNAPEHSALDTDKGDKKPVPSESTEDVKAEFISQNTLSDVGERRYTKTEEVAIRELHHLAEMFHGCEARGDCKAIERNMMSKQFGG